MSEIKSLITSVLEQGYLMSLATYDDGGPWVSDVVFVHDEDFNIYWLSREHTRHSQAILKNPKVACSITVSTSRGETNKGLQIEGLAKKIEGDVFSMAVKHRLKKGKPAPETEGEIIKEKGESWYMLTPTKIELIFEPKFGFIKQALELSNHEQITTK